MKHLHSLLLVAVVCLLAVIAVNTYGIYRVLDKGTVSIEGYTTITNDNNHLVPVQIKAYPGN
ncbi:hypothetical protein R4036_004597 [Salmonella enterica]|nr:hypothetical protein [Salmonella enterica]